MYRSPVFGVPPSQSSVPGLAARNEIVDLAAVGHEVAGLVGVRGERNRRTRLAEHQVLQSLHLRGRELREIPEPLDGGKTCTAARRAKGFAQQPRAGRLRDAARGQEPVLLQRAAAQQQRGRLIGTQRLGRQLDLVGRDLEHRPHRGHRSDLRAFGPRRVGRQDQRRDTTAPRREDRLGRIAPDVGAVFEERIHSETLRATLSMSEASGASSTW